MNLRVYEKESIEPAGIEAFSDEAPRTFRWDLNLLRSTIHLQRDTRRQ